MNKKLKSKKVCNLGKRGILGYHLGYPMCCIKSFENNINAFNSSDKQHIAFQIIENSGFGGYIPCHNCSAAASLCPEPRIPAPETRAPCRPD